MGSLLSLSPGPVQWVQSLRYCRQYYLGTEIPSQASDVGARNGYFSALCTWKGTDGRAAGACCCTALAVLPVLAAVGCAGSGPQWYVRCTGNWADRGLGASPAHFAQDVLKDRPATNVKVGRGASSHPANQCTASVLAGLSLFALPLPSTLASTCQYKAIISFLHRSPPGPTPASVAAA